MALQILCEPQAHELEVCTAAMARLKRRNRADYLT